MWLRDSLPKDITSQYTNRPMARIMTYGYESTVADSNNFQNIEDLATGFHQNLASLLEDDLAVRPILIIAHSLGGLIVKQVRFWDASSRSGSKALNRL